MFQLCESTDIVYCIDDRSCGNGNTCELDTSFIFYAGSVFVPVFAWNGNSAVSAGRIIPGFAAFIWDFPYGPDVSDSNFLPGGDTSGMGTNDCKLKSADKYGADVPSGCHVRYGAGSDDSCEMYCALCNSNVCWPVGIL